MDAERLCIYCMRERRTVSNYCPYCGGQDGQYKPASHHLEPWTILNGRYLLGKALGSGGFGITYIAMDLAEEKRVAIKESFVSSISKREGLRVELLNASDTVRAYHRECEVKFRQEADLMKQLESLGTLPEIYAYFEENNTAYIVMEYLEGIDLLAYLHQRNEKISMEEAFRLLRPIMKTVMAMQVQGIYHRDIAPDNIRYQENGRMRLMDLGGAKNNFSLSSGLSSIVLLKPGYAPPEQYMSQYKVGPWMDVYAMSATFYRCVTGKVPDPAIDRYPDDPVKPPNSVGANIPAKAEKIIMKGLAYKVEDRYIDMMELYYALKAICLPQESGKSQPVTPGGGGDGKSQPVTPGGGGDGKSQLVTPGGGGDGKSQLVTPGGGGNGESHVVPSGGGSGGEVPQPPAPINPVMVATIWVIVVIVVIVIISLIV